MKKKNIAILLLLPYIIALLGVITVNVTFKLFANDLSYIKWDYETIEAFQLTETADGKYARHHLRATGVSSSDLPLAENNELIWIIDENDCAELVEEGGEWYLCPKGEGEVKVTCQNKKGNVARQMTVIFYKTSAIVVYPRISPADFKIDETEYYGVYDLNKRGNKVLAEIDLVINCYPKELASTLAVEVHTEDLIEYKDGVFSVKEDHVITGKTATASFTVSCGVDEAACSKDYSFALVKDGVNVYTYDDLLNCTNRSKNGEITVLRKSFESLENSKRTDVNNIACFGKADSNGSFNFSKDVYRFSTTANDNYIDQWNAFAKKDSRYDPISNSICVGLHVQKDFYGNGYTINMHNLCFPYEKMDGRPYLGENNLFRGPLPFYSLGTPYNSPIITAYGQDNIGMYVHGDNITVNDVNLKNCDIGDSFSNLEYTGTVMEVRGDNVTVQNSVLQNGKHVLRVISSENALIDNCLLQNALNFLLSTGCDEYVPVDGEQTFSFVPLEGKEETVTMTLNDFLDSISGEGNSAFNTFLMGTYSVDRMRATLQSIQDALDSVGADLPYGGTVTVNDTFFYRSGIASICMESSFNGAFLQSRSPSFIAELFAFVQDASAMPLVPMTPTNMAGVSYPVHLSLSGSTRFYDYKTSEDMDLTYLIDENLSEKANGLGNGLLGDKDINVTIDHFFPLKGMLYNQASGNGCLYTPTDSADSYLNVVVAFYGGGLNRSTVSIDALEDAVHYSDEMSVDMVESYLPQQIDPTDFSGLMRDTSKMKVLMQKTVSAVIGTRPFRFVCMKGDGYLYGETPSVRALRENNLR
ncbi:MAG: hypothetical protein IJW30_05825 [Clostridia bacterium]|nr:hypothetical protein [Clostridia bacterium]